MSSFLEPEHVGWKVPGDEIRVQTLRSSLRRECCDHFNAEIDPQRVSDWQSLHFDLHAGWHRLHDLLHLAEARIRWGRA